MSQSKARVQKKLQVAGRLPVPVAHPGLDAPAASNLRPCLRLPARSRAVQLEVASAAAAEPVATTRPGRFRAPSRGTLMPVQQGGPGRGHSKFDRASSF